MTGTTKIYTGGVAPPTDNRYHYDVTGRTMLWEITPLAKGTAVLAALQTLGGAGNMVLTAGTGVTSRVGPTGVTWYDLDVPRAITLTSAGNISGVNFTITGIDDWGYNISHVMAGPNANTVTSTKCFKTIISIAANGAVGTNTSVGIDDIFEFPICVLDRGFVPVVFWNGASDTGGTFTAAVTTDPATTTTGSPRGKWAVSSAADGVKKLIAGIHMSNAQVAAAAGAGNIKLFRGVTQ